MKRCDLRSAFGISLVEMLATILIMGMVAAAISEIAVTQNVIAFRTFNKLDALTNARRVASYIERDIHNACFVGNQMSSSPSQFLGYTLGEQTLILQVPIFYSPSVTGGISAIPTQVSINGTVPVNGVSTPYTSIYWNVDTIVYQVVGDTSRAGTGQFILQKTVYPGTHLAGYEPAQIASQQAVLAGIVGPIDLSQNLDPVAGTNAPNIFGYFSKQSPIYANSSKNNSNGYIPGDPVDASNINGVSMNFEVFSNAASKRIDLTPKSMAFRSEVYVRGNYYSP